MSKQQNLENLMPMSVILTRLLILSVVFFVIFLAARKGNEMTINTMGSHGGVPSVSFLFWGVALIASWIGAFIYIFSQPVG